MRALRAIYTAHQHLVTSNTQKTLISFHLSRHFTSTTRIRQQQQPQPQPQPNPDKWAELETETGKQYMGVRRRPHSGRFQASYGNKKRPKVLLGEFDTAEEAALAYDRATYRKYGPKARLNFPHLFINSDSTTTTTTTTGSVNRSSNKKLKAIYVCSKCGERHPLWVGQCRGCGVFNAVKQHFSDNGGKDIADKSHDIVKSIWSAVESDSAAGSIGIKGSETEAIELDKTNESNRNVVKSDSGVGSSSDSEPRRVWSESQETKSSWSVGETGSISSIKVRDTEMAPASLVTRSGDSDKTSESSWNVVESIGIKESETAPASLGIVSGESEKSTESCSDAEPRRVWSVFAPTTTPCPKSLGNESSENEKTDKSIPDPDPISESKPVLAHETSSKAEPRSPQEPSSDPKPTSNSEPRRGWSHFTPTNRESVSSKGSFKKSKGKVRWVCSDCGEPHAQWGGQCRSCGEYNTLKQFSENGGKDNRTVAVSQEVVRPWLPRGEEVKPVRLKELNRGVSWKDRRIPLCGTFGEEVAMVLGGGVVPGSLVLIGGDPGVGKSTLALQIASIIAQGPELGKTSPVVYVSGEESIEQIGGRADRMGIDSDGLFLYSSTDIEDIFEKIQSIAPQALVIDSIQTVYLKGVAGSAGGIVQVRECTSSLLYFAKKTNIPIFLIGHVTKSGEIAGPRVLEHIVDVVLYMEGEKGSSYRLLRSVKNRFGSTDELGVFEMSQSGLQSVLNPSGMFLGEQHPDSDCLAGLAVAVIMDGNRSFLIEIQALCVSGSAASLPGSASPVSRKVNGIQGSRADMIISVLAKQAGLKLQDNAIFLNVISGETLKETAGDLAIAVAICSSFLESPIPNSIAFIGEIGLSGELRSVPAMEKRINTVAKLGYETCIVPKSAEKSLGGTPGFKDIKIIGCKSLKEVINNVFK